MLISPQLTAYSKPDSLVFEWMDLFKIAFDDRRGLQIHPLLQHRPINTSEIDGVLQVLAVLPVGRV
jgi:hypothetical protein